MRITHSNSHLNSMNFLIFHYCKKVQISQKKHELANWPAEGTRVWTRSLNHSSHQSVPHTTYQLNKVISSFANRICSRIQNEKRETNTNQEYKNTTKNQTQTSVQRHTLLPYQNQATQTKFTIEKQSTLLNSRAHYPPPLTDGPPRARRHSQPHTQLIAPIAAGAGIARQGSRHSPPHTAPTAALTGAGIAARPCTNCGRWLNLNHLHVSTRWSSSYFDQETRRNTQATFHNGSRLGKALRLLGDRWRFWRSGFGSPGCLVRQEGVVGGGTI